MTFRVGSLFAGIGGFDLAAEWLGWKTAWFSEIDPYASAVLKKHWPDVPNHGDITAMRGSEIEPVDVLCGGFPCQDISLAGKGAGIDGERSGLWSHYARLIDEIRPSFVVAENVSALKSRGLDRVLWDLWQIGYDAEWHCIPASAVGAPHRRDRIWIVAYSAGQSQPESRHEAEAIGYSGDTRLVLGGSGSRQRDANAAPELADAQGVGRSQGRAKPEGQQGGFSPTGCGSPLPNADSLPEKWATISRYQRGQWESEPDVGRVANGVPSRVDRLKCLGNALVPQVAYEVFSAIERMRLVMSVGQAA